MSTDQNQAAAGGYGFTDDEDGIGSSGGLSFGLNAGVAYLTKFEYITNGGADGAEGEALDVIFTVNGVEKSSRKFPVTKAFAKGDSGEEITDPNSPEMKQAFKDMGAWLTHVVHVFTSKENIQAALSQPIPDFKTYVGILTGLLPTGFEKVALDIFGQWQWKASGQNTRTFLEIPKSMKHGRWLAKAVPAVNADGSPGEWREVRVDNPSDSTVDALKYVDGAGNVHPFIRSGWFMNSNYAVMQKDPDDTDGHVPGANLGGTSADAAAGTAAAPGKGW